MVIWYDRPAEEFWVRTLHLGNGILGASVFGGAEKEKIVLNHTKLWRHCKTLGRVNPDCTAQLKRVRKLMFEGKLEEANNMAYRALGTQFTLHPEHHYFGPDPFVPAGELHVEFPGHTEPEGYRSQLDLSTALGTTSYTTGGVCYTREAFTSFDSLLFAWRVRADKPGAINCTLRLTRVPDDQCELHAAAAGDEIALTGTFFEGRKFAIVTRLNVHGGKREASVSGECPEVAVSGADCVEAYTFIATDMEDADPLAYARGQLDAAYGCTYVEMFKAHTRKFCSLFGRVRFELKGPDYSSLPTDKRMERFAAGEDDPALQAVYYQYGRYILLCSSINGGLPSNLNGIWNDLLKPSYMSDYHHDLNSQASYWPAETGNLTETTEALFDYVDSLVPAARDAARKLYGCRGIFIPLTTGCYPEECLKLEHGWDEWTGAAAWLGQHYWQHWDFTRDVGFLRGRCYPFLKEAALFYMDYLVPDPRKDHRFYGMLQAVPSYSPENAFEGTGKAPVSLSITCTMDIELITEVFTHLLEASALLGLDKDMRHEWKRVLGNLPPIQIGSYGQIQEWLEDYNEDYLTMSSEGIGHRHASHLYGLFPGDSITRTKTPVLAKAAEVSVMTRVLHKANRLQTFGPLYAALFARLGRAGSAYENLRLFEQNMYPKNNNFSEGLRAGSSEAMLELVVQSQDGAIDLLPALPAQWSGGHVAGIVARGGFVVDVSWEAGSMTGASIRSRLGGRCVVRCQGNTAEIDTQARGEYRFGPGLTRVSCGAGKDEAQ